MKWVPSNVRCPLSPNPEEIQLDSALAFFTSKLRSVICWKRHFLGGVIKLRESSTTIINAISRSSSAEWLGMKRLGDLVI